MGTYSFLDTICVMAGPGLVATLGAGGAATDEGITISANDDIDHMDIGADGSVMHSLHANKGGEITVRLQKTSPMNSLLQLAYNFQTSNASQHGQNTFTLVNIATGDNINASQVAFKKAVSLTYAKDAGMNEWTFTAGKITRTLGVAA